MDTVPLLNRYEMVLPPDVCSYLPEETSSLSFRVYENLDASAFEQLLRRGWRRHGQHIFRPNCPACRKCRSLRIQVPQFQPTKSQRRAQRRNDDVRLVVQEPSISDQHLELFNRYHHDMSRRRGWPDRSLTAAEYHEAFVDGGYKFAKEFLYYRDDTLLGVGLVDVAVNGLSSAYFYHDPDWRPESPGTFTILKEIEYARMHKIQYVYLGYWISQCISMAYKSRFGPHELLDEYVGDSEQPCWRPAAE